MSMRVRSSSSQPAAAAAATSLAGSSANSLVRASVTVEMSRKDRKGLRSVACPFPMASTLFLMFSE